MGPPGMYANGSVGLQPNQTLPWPRDFPVEYKGWIIQKAQATTQGQKRSWRRIECVDFEVSPYELITKDPKSKPVEEQYAGLPDDLLRSHIHNIVQDCNRTEPNPNAKWMMARIDVKTQDIQTTPWRRPVRTIRQIRVVLQKVPSAPGGQESQTRLQHSGNDRYLAPNVHQYEIPQQMPHLNAPRGVSGPMPPQPMAANASPNGPRPGIVNNQQQRPSPPGAYMQQGVPNMPSNNMGPSAMAAAIPRGGEGPLPPPPMPAPHPTAHPNMAQIPAKGVPKKAKKINGKKSKASSSSSSDWESDSSRDANTFQKNTKRQRKPLKGSKSSSHSRRGDSDSELDYDESVKQRRSSRRGSSGSRSRHSRPDTFYRHVGIPRPPPGPEPIRYSPRSSTLDTSAWAERQSRGRDLPHSVQRRGSQREDAPRGTNRSTLEDRGSSPSESGRSYSSSRFSRGSQYTIPSSVSSREGYLAGKYHDHPASISRSYSDHRTSRHSHQGRRRQHSPSPDHNKRTTIVNNYYSDKQTPYPQETGYIPSLPPPSLLQQGPSDYPPHHNPHRPLPQTLHQPHLQNPASDPAAAMLQGFDLGLKRQAELQQSRQRERRLQQELRRTEDVRRGFEGLGLGGEGYGIRGSMLSEDEARVGGGVSGGRFGYGGREGMGL